MTPAESRQPVLVNLGSGESGSGRVPGWFGAWRQLRVDIDPSTRPDVLASMTDLSAIDSDVADGVWASHCLEHLYRHEVPTALSEIRRILRPEGFVCIRVPDLQTVAGYIASDQMQDVLYHAPVGPVTVHDVVFGYGPDVANGVVAMAHRTGFTPTILSDSLKSAGFPAFLLRRMAGFELVALARKTPWSDDAQAAQLLDSFRL